MIFFNQNALIPQHVLIPSNCILPDTLQQNVSIPPYCILLTHFHNSSINIGSISFFSSSDIHQSHHLLRCHTAGINSSLISFLSSLGFSNLICLTKNLSWLDWKLKTICLAKKLCWLEKKNKTICLTKKLSWLEKN